MTEPDHFEAQRSTRNMLDALVSNFADCFTDAPDFRP